MSVSSNIHRDRLRRAAALLLAASAATLFACSGPDGFEASADLDPAELVREANMSPDEREAEFQRRHATPLAEDEMIAVESRLRELGVDMTEVGFSGRMLTFGDTYLSADALLSLPRDPGALVEKGTTLSVIDNTPSIDGLAMAPTLFSRRFNNKYQFLRPDIDSVTIVTPSAASATFLFSAFQQAAAAIWGAANDCLLPGAVVVRTLSQWNTFPLEVQYRTKAIFVAYGPQGTVCPGFDAEAKACALFPRAESRFFNTSFLTRVVPGPRIGVVSSAITSNTPATVGILMHELLHTLGVAHPSDPGSTKVTQTSSSNTVTSVMQSCVPGSVGCNISQTLSFDDIDVIDTLYSPQLSAGCAYEAGLKDIVAN